MAVILAVVVMTMTTSNQQSTYASPTTEDDGYTYDEGASDEEKEEQDEQEREEWEDAGRPGDNDDDEDNEDDEEQMFTCSDGSTVTEDEDCPSTGPNPYCDTEKGKAARVCHDRLDYDQDTGLYPCNDGTNKVDWKDCKDATIKNGNNDDDDSTKTIQTTTTISNSAEESSCRLDGSADGIQQSFDSIKYQACGLYTNAQKAYSDGFVMGCTQIGNTQLICQSLVDSNILNMNSQPMQKLAQPTQTQTQTQPTQGIQPALVGG